MRDSFITSFMTDQRIYTFPVFFILHTFCVIIIIIMIKRYLTNSLINFHSDEIIIIISSHFKH